VDIAAAGHWFSTYGPVQSLVPFGLYSWKTATALRNVRLRRLDAAGAGGERIQAAELAIALGATGLMYNRMNLGAYNLHFADRLLPSPAMIRENLEMLEALDDKYKLPIVVSVVVEPCVVDVRNYPSLHFGWCPLAGERSYFTIDPVGNVRICNHSPTIVGNIHRDHFPDIYYHHPYVRRFRETWPVECAECAPELKEMCGGGCKAAGEQCFGTLERVDPFVTLHRRQGASPSSCKPAGSSQV